MQHESPLPDQPAAATPGAQPQSELSEKQRQRALVVCLVAGAMTLLDVSIVNVALPSIREGLGAGASTIGWVLAGYSLAFGVLLVPAGRLGDARSRRTVFVAGVTLFTLASAACGLAQSPEWLAVARVLQGFGGGLIAPQVSGFIQTMFSGAARARAFGLFGATVGVSTAVGPVLGGVLVQAGGPDLGWRLVFMVNVPVGVVLVLLALRWLPRAEPGRRQSLDPVGVVLFAAALTLLLWPVVQGEQGAPLGERPWWLAGVAVVVMTGFVVWERRWTRSGREPLLELALLRVRSFTLGVGVGMCYFAGFTAIFVVLTLYLQEGLGYTALQAGLTQLPFAISSAVAAFVAGRLVSRFGRGLVVLGLVVVVASLLAVDLMVPRLDGMEGLKLAPVLLLAGLGGGLVISPNITLALSEVPPVMAGAGGGLLQTAQRVGAALGVAVVLAVFFQVAAGNGDDLAEALSVSLRTTIVLIGLALVIGVLDLRRRVRPGPEGSEPS